MRTEPRMHFPTFDWHPTRRHLRQFAWLTALILAVLSWAGASPWTLYLRLAAALVFAVGTVLPGVLRWPYVAILLFLYPFGLLGNRLLRAFWPYTPRRQNREQERFRQHHERQPATGTHR